MDGRGQATVQTEVYCTVKNKEKLVATSILSNESYPHDTVKPEDKDTAEVERKKFIDAAIEYINTKLSEVLSSESAKPTEQQQVDDLLM